MYRNLKVIFGVFLSGRMVKKDLLLDEYLDYGVVKQSIKPKVVHS